MSSTNFVLGPQTKLLLADLDISIANVLARAGLSERCSPVEQRLSRSRSTTLFGLLSTRRPMTRRWW